MDFVEKPKIINMNSTHFSISRLRRIISLLVPLEPTLIYLMIYMRQNIYHSVLVKTIDHMVLYEGPSQKVIHRVILDLHFTPYNVSYPASFHLISVAVHSTVLKSVVKETSDVLQSFLCYCKLCIFLV